MQNLRVAICFNPDAPDLSQRLEANPALLSDTTCVWLDGGGTQQQAAVAAAAVATVPPEAAAGTPLDTDALTATLQGLHEVAEQITRAAPHHFAALLRQCLHMYTTKKAEILEQVDFLQVGISPLPCK